MNIVLFRTKPLPEGLRIPDNVLGLDQKYLCLRTCFLMGKVFDARGAEKS